MTRSTTCSAGAATPHGRPARSRRAQPLCHGTAGNGFAFLELARRTGDEVWLHRAQRFAMHAMQQCEPRLVASTIRACKSWFAGKE